MPYKDPAVQRQAQNIWMWRRRTTWILENGPCRWCGTTSDLQVTWKSPSLKQMKVASIWSRNDELRAELLADCEVLCEGCAKRKIKIWRAVKAALS